MAAMYDAARSMVDWSHTFIGNVSCSMLIFCLWICQGTQFTIVTHQTDNHYDRFFVGFSPKYRKKHMNVCVLYFQTFELFYNWQQSQRLFRCVHEIDMDNHGILSTIITHCQCPRDDCWNPRLPDCDDGDMRPSTCAAVKRKRGDSLLLLRGEFMTHRSYNVFIRSTAQVSASFEQLPSRSQLHFDDIVYRPRTLRGAEASTIDMWTHADIVLMQSRDKRMYTLNDDGGGVAGAALDVIYIHTDAND